MPLMAVSFVLQRCLLATFFLSTLAQAEETTQRPPNVLVIFADDLGPRVGSYGDPVARTPALDALARSGVQFNQAFCQFPVCNPSRTSMMTGRYPSTNGIVFNGTHHFRNLHPEYVTLPEYFKKHGYITANSGKLFHGKTQDPQSWTEFIPDGVPPEAKGSNAPVQEIVSEKNGVRTSFKYRALPGDGEGDVDYWIAENGIKLLEKYRDQPFFIGIGFHRPHAIPTAPQRFYDLYDAEKLTLPEDFAETPTPPPGFPSFVLPEKNDTFYVDGPVPPSLARQILRSYYASVSFFDWNVGRVLDALDRLGLRENTIVVLGSDHGYHNGEKGRWGKTTIFDAAEHVPLVIRVPGAAANGQASDRPVQLLDLYPTLAALAKLAPPEGVQGHDLSPLLADPKARWPYPALSMAKTAGNSLAYIARTEDWFYAEWKGGEAGAVLVDRKSDPRQTKNLIDDPALQPVVQQLKTDLAKGFGPMPSSLRPPPGSDRPLGENTEAAGD